MLGDMSDRALEAADRDAVRPGEETDDGMLFDL